MEPTTITVMNPYTQQAYVFVDNTEQGAEVNPPEKPDENVCLHNKKRGVSSEVFPFTLSEAHDVIGYFREHGMWQHYLAFVFGFNTARRAGDILDLTWDKIYNPDTGKMREELDIKEQKTDKFARPKINQACRDAILLYIKMNSTNPAANGYKDKVFIQHSGTHVGKVLSYDGYRKGIKRAAAAVGIEKNVGTHSARKSFGMTNRYLHYGDQNNMEILRSIFNHSDTKTTSRYIGLTREQANQYYDDIGKAFADYVTGDKTYDEKKMNPIVALDVNDLRDIISAAYGAGLENSGAEDPMKHVEAIGNIMKLVDEMRK